MSTGPDLEKLDIIGNDTYADHGYPHAAWEVLRREAPVYWWDRGIEPPFWAITKHADVIWISKQPKRMLNAPRLAAFPEGPPLEERNALTRHLLNMDPPEHGRFRRVSSSWFTPRTIERLRPGVERISRDLVDALGQAGEEAEIDFVESVTAPLTLSVLADMLGVPREDWPLMFRWTNQIAGASDPEYQEGRTATETMDDARNSLFSYFKELAEKRRQDPRDDIVSVVANGKVNGLPLPMHELLSYYLLLVVAGNETTRNAASGGLLALIENPEQFEKLRRNPELIDSAVEEIVRWTSPVIQFCREATEDFELRGQKIRAGESMCLFYPSANRDEEVFEAPNEFRVDRDPNPHVGFGQGEHFCLGANLARIELRVIFRDLIARLDHVELAGPVERVRSSFLGGVKRMPIRYRLSA